jgi:hypothetical protein
MDERTRRLRELRRWGAPYDGLGMIPREDGTFVRWADVLAVLDTDGDQHHVTFGPDNPSCPVCAGSGTRCASHDTREDR